MWQTCSAVVGLYFKHWWISHGTPAPCSNRNLITEPSNSGAIHEPKSCMTSYAYHSAFICPRHIEDILQKWPYLPCVSMAGRALLAGYHRNTVECRYDCAYSTTNTEAKYASEDIFTKDTTCSYSFVRIWEKSDCVITVPRRMPWDTYVK